MNEQVILKAVNVIKVYLVGNEELVVLKGINLEVAKGDTIGIFGPSGSGKSTLLHILGTLDRPTSGYIEMMGRDLGGLSDRELSAMRNRMIGFVFQFHYLIPELNLLENVATPLLIAGEGRREAMRKAMHILEEVGLADRWRHHPDELSGGERQRGAVARALVTSPEIILADEPTGNLDNENSEKLMKLMVELNEKLNTTLLVVTHNESFMRYFDRNYRLVDGRLFEV